MNRAVLGIIAIVLIAGCVGQTDSTGGGTNIGTADVIVATNEPTIPAQPVASSAFTARFTVRNQDADKTAKSVGIWIFDTGRCTLKNINGKDAAVMIVEQGTQTVWAGLDVPSAQGPKRMIDFSPGQQEVVRLDLDAPSTEQIAGLAATCPIRYKVNYSFDAVTEVTIQAISQDRLATREAETGTRPVYTRTLNVGAGPIRVMIEPKSAMPIQTGRTLSAELTVTNEGTGEFSKVDTGRLSFTLDKDWTPALNGDGQACGGFFDVKDSADGKSKTYTNSRPFDVLQGTSNPITCQWTAPAVSLEKEFVIQARLPYEYEYFGREISVPITP
ncbi:MAG: hypothetical protein V1887_02430 [Candidatus Aenigmatarchaeota archaeon]